MKQTIRFNTYETNSSSTHTVTIIEDREYFESLFSNDLIYCFNANDEIDDSLTECPIIITTGTLEKFISELNQVESSWDILRSYNIYENIYVYIDCREVAICSTNKVLSDGKFISAVSVHIYD